MKELLEKLEKYRTIYAKYFYMIGDDESYQDICTMSDERILNDAIAFAINHFEKEIDFLQKIKEN